MKNVILTLLASTLSFYSIAQKQKQTEFHVDETYALSKTGTVYLNAHDAKVIITGENRKDVAVKIDYYMNSKGLEWGTREFTVEVNERDGDLHIEELRSDNSTIMGSVSTDYKINIKAPIGSNWEIIGDDDDYNLTSINGSISIDADDADVILKSCQGSKFYFDLDDGDVFMDEAKGELTARMDDGDIEIRNAAFETIDYRGDDGDVSIETSIGPNAMFKLSGDDSTFDLVFTNGGGTFTIKHDNGNIDYDNNFQVTNKEENRMALSLTGGRGKVIISGDDIRVNLSSTQSN
jgi:hypothetical protein